MDAGALIGCSSDQSLLQACIVIGVTLLKNVGNFAATEGIADREGGGDRYRDDVVLRRDVGSGDPVGDRAREVVGRRSAYLSSAADRDHCSGGGEGRDEGGDGGAIGDGHRDGVQGVIDDSGGARRGCEGGDRLGRGIESPDGTHQEIVGLGVGFIEAIKEGLGIRVDRVVLGRAPVDAIETTDRDPVLVQLVELILARQVPVAVAAAGVIIANLRCSARVARLSHHEVRIGLPRTESRQSIAIQCGLRSTARYPSDS